jgi:hypothetical protein
MFLLALEAGDRREILHNQRVGLVFSISSIVMSIAAIMVTIASIVMTIASIMVTIGVVSLDSAIMLMAVGVTTISIPFRGVGLLVERFNVSLSIAELPLAVLFIPDVVI